MVCARPWSEHAGNKPRFAREAREARFFIFKYKKKCTQKIFPCGVLFVFLRGKNLPRELREGSEAPEAANLCQHQDIDHDRVNVAEKAPIDTCLGPPS